MSVEGQLAEVRRTLTLTVGGNGHEDTVALAKRTVDEIKRLRRGWQRAEAERNRYREALEYLAERPHDAGYREVARSALEPNNQTGGES